MANRDIAGLLTGIPSGGIDPRVGMTGRQMLVQSALAGQERMAGGLRGMLGGKPTIQQQLVQAMGEQQKERGEMLKNFSNLSTDEQRNTINALRAKGDSESIALAGQLASQLRQEKADILSQQRLDLEEKRLEESSRRLLAGDRQAIREASNASQKAGARASTLLGLADDYARVKPTGGFFGSAYSAWTKTFGTQGEVDRIKTQFQAIVNTDIINNLPPGVASDKDIEMAKSGYMNPSWNAEEIEMFLRGQAKLAAYAAEREDAKATWIEKNAGSLAGFNTAWRETIEGEGYKDMIRDKYNLPSYKLDLQPAVFNPENEPTVTPSLPTASQRGNVNNRKAPIPVPVDRTRGARMQGRG